MNAPQLKDLITSHRGTVKEYDFENVVLTGNGNWDDALAPIYKDEDWSRGSLTTASDLSFVTNDSSEDLPSPSAAVEAASRELLDVDLGGFAFSDEDRDVVESLSDELVVARDANMSCTSLSCTTNLKRKRVRRRRRRHHNEDKIEEDEHHEESLFGQLSRAASFRRPSRPHLKPSIETIRPPSPPPVPITAPILNADPQPVLLQPTVYDPSNRQQSPPDEGISSVQRNLEQEEAHRRLAEDASARRSALQRAKEVVLMKLSREFCNGRRAAAANAGASRGAEAVNACRLMAGRDFANGGIGCGVEVVEDHRRGFDSRSILVPLMFARA